MHNATLTMQQVESMEGFVEIRLEDVQLVKDYDIILHVIKPTKISKLITLLEDSAKNLNWTEKEFELKHEFDILRIKLQTISRHRHQRGLINIIGTGMKWLYGTMDDNDRQNIEEHLRITDENNHMAISTLNKNIKINEHFNKTITNLANTILSDRIKVEATINNIQSIFGGILLKKLTYLEILFKIKIISDSIEQVQNNLASARLGIMTSNILTNEEIVKYKIDIFRLENIRLGAAEYKNSDIIFTIQIPKDTIQAKRSLFTPITNLNSEELIFQTQQIINVNNVNYTYKENLYFKELEKSKLCIFNRNCKKIKNYREEIVELEKGMLLLKNQKYSFVESTCDERKLYIKQNYLFHFSNCELNINNVTYKNLNENFEQRYVIPNFNTNINITSKELSFDEIVLNQFENIEKVEELLSNKKINKTCNYLTFVLLAIIVIIIIIFGFKIFKNKKNTILNVTANTQESLASKGGGVMPTQSSVPINWSA